MPQAYKSVSGWTQQLEWQYEWDVHDNLTEARKYDGSGAVYAGKVEYVYSPVVGAGRTERIEYDSSDAITSWVRYEVDGLQVHRVDEKYDNHSPGGITEADGWRIRDRRTHSPALIGSLLFKEVFTYPSATSNANAESKVYYYGYDKQGNVSVVTEEYCGGTAERFIFSQDAFGNELTHGIFDRSSWLEAAKAGITEHQTGKEFDQFTGLYYFHARWYDPAVGRFVSRSPLGPDEEGPYLYCESDPINNVDVNGLSVLEDIANFSAGYADTFTFGLSALARDGLSYLMTGRRGSLIDRCSKAYTAGELADLLGTGLLGAGSKFLKRLARRTDHANAGRAAKRFLNNFYPERGYKNGYVIHHRLPLFGHFGGHETLWPTGALPAWMNSMPIIMTQKIHGANRSDIIAKHARLHRKLRKQERWFSPLISREILIPKGVFAVYNRSYHQCR